MAGAVIGGRAAGWFMRARGRRFWLLIAGACWGLFLANLALVTSGTLFWHEEALRNRIFNAFHTALPFDALPYLHAIALQGVARHPTRVTLIAVSVVVMLLMLGLIALRRPWSALLLPVPAAMSVVLARVIKGAVVHRGVWGSHGHTFPSGHAAGSCALFSCAVLIVWGITRRRWIRWAALAALLVPLTLTLCSELTFHYPSEVAGGYLLAGGCLALAVWALHPRLVRELRCGSW